MGNNIYAYLRKNGKTIEWLAEQTGYSYEEMKQIADGQDDDLTWKEKDKIAKPFGTNGLYLFHIIY